MLVRQPLQTCIMASSGLPPGVSLPDPSLLPTLEVDHSNRPPRRISTGSSVLDEGAIEEHGRTFHHYKADTYFLPNDAEEQNRLDLQHKVLSLSLDNRLSLAPIHNPKSVLDIGTGTGIWAIQFAKQNPHCRVIGSDLSLIQPSGAVSNCEFIREDAEGDEWTYNRYFDYIHVRLVSCFVTNVQTVIQKGYEHLEPGGWMEFQEFTQEILSSDDTIKGTAFKTINSIWSGVMVAHGRNPWAMTHLKSLLIKVGFVDVFEEVRLLPIGSWPTDEKHKEIGWWHGINCLEVLGACVKVLVKSGLTTGQAEALVEQAKTEIRNGHSHAHQLFYVVYGRKPLP